MFKAKHPKGLYNLFFIEMWERFGFYLLLGILKQYMTDRETGGLGLSNELSSEIYGWYIALVYLTPFLGGLIADRFLGYRRSVFIGGTLLAAGYALLAVPDMTTFYAALALLVVGNGFFKANISTMVGKLYAAGDPLRDAGYSIFYMGINIGGFLCNFVASFMRNKFGWPAAFLAGAAGMALGVVILVFSYKRLAGADRRDENAAKSGGLNELLTLAILPALGVGAAGFFIAENLIGEGQGIKYAFFAAVIPIIGFFVRILVRSPKVERPRIGALLAVFGCVVVFWMIFHQNGDSLTLMARDETNRQMPPSVTKVMSALDLAERAPPSYYKNAGPEVPRPDRSALRILPDAEFKRVAEDAKAREAFAARGEIPLTQTMADEMYRRAGPTTPVLPKGEPLLLVSTELFQSWNALFIVLFTPLVVGVFAFLRRRNREPSTPAKLLIALVTTAGACGLLALASVVGHHGEDKVSFWWLTNTYLMLTIAELCLSPIGLSLVSKLAPARVAGLMMGGWFLATSLGNKLAGFMGGLWDSMRHDHLFLLNGALVLVSALAVVLLLPWLRRVMKESGA
jgi:POT family proton-dependent oligopeptide transporter